MFQNAHRINRWFLVCAVIMLATGVTYSQQDEPPRNRSFFDGTYQAEAEIVERQYAPDRMVDILHVTIDITPNFKTRTIAGTTTIKFAPIARPLTELRLDAIDLGVSSVTSSAEIAGYNVTDKAITITFDPPVPPGTETAVKIIYEAEPKQGLYFHTPESGTLEEDTHLRTQGQTHEAPHWYPNYDYPNERFTSEVICRVPKDMTVLSNGRLVSEQIDKESGLKTVTWLQDKPHVNYLIALAAGYFKKIEAHYKDLPVAFYTPPSQIDQAQGSFKNTVDMIAFYEKEIGVAYPWDKYYQVVVEEFGGGMENTSLTILGDRTLFTEESENIDSSQMLVAHELAHQWFGDYVTCKDWSHLWLNEGFAVLYEKLYDGHKNGRDSMLYEFYKIERQVLSDRPIHKPIVNRSYEDAWEQFDYRAYLKGAWVLRMLRCELGKNLFRQCVKTYLERHAFGIVETDDFRSVIEELTGRSFDRFFDQWIYHARHPDLKVSYEWIETDKLAKVSVEQTHEVNENVMLFHFRTKVRFIVDSQPVDREILVDNRQHDFYFPLKKQPSIVRFDTDFGLLANITFEKPKAMLYAQLDNKNDVIGRLLATTALGEENDKKTVAKLKDALNNDPFYGIRIAASTALCDIHNNEAFDALVESVSQSDARVRQQVVRDIGGFYRPESFKCTKQILKNEKNPEILASAIDNLGKYHHKDTRQILMDYLKSKSYRNRLASAAVQAIRMLDEPFFIEPLQKTLSERAQQFPSADFARALDTLAYIARNEDNKTKVRDFLADYVNNPKRKIQAGAIAALGTLGDSSAIPIVETFSDDEPDDSIEHAAQEALEKLREHKELVPEEIIQLRETVDKLNKETDEMKNDLDDIKKRLDAKEESDEKADKDEAINSSENPTPAENDDDSI